jgi:hypothetical protein
VNDYSGLSRHDRRRQARREAKLTNKRLGSVEVVGDAWLLEHAERNPEFAHWFAEWVDRIDIPRPLCLHCTHTFGIGGIGSASGRFSVRTRTAHSTRRSTHPNNRVVKARAGQY